MYEFLDFQHIGIKYTKIELGKGARFWTLVGLLFSTPPCFEHRRTRSRQQNCHNFTKPLIVMSIVMTPWERKKEKKKANATVPMILWRMATCYFISFMLDMLWSPGECCECPLRYDRLLFCSLTSSLSHIIISTGGSSDLNSRVTHRPVLTKCCLLLR